MVVTGGPRPHDRSAPRGRRCRRRRPARLRRVRRGTLRFDRRLPLRLAALYRTTEVGDTIGLTVDGDQPPNAPSLDDLILGAGFTANRERPSTIVRALSLPDTVAPRMRLLICGLNPSIYAAERGVGFARTGNRFWRAGVAAGLVTRERDAMHALRVHRVGMTDLCKRATVASAQLTDQEYVDGAARVERLVRWMQPAVVAFVGLEGWRTAIDRGATAGLQPSLFGGRPAYVLPSTSGLNAHARLDDLVDHLRAVAAVAAGV